jgi:ABC-2 type transport system permease protein
MTRVACSVVMAVLLVSMYAGIGLNSDVGKGITSRFRSLPVWRPAPVAGAVLGDAARYLTAAGLVTVLGVIMGYRPPGGTAGVLAGTACCSCSRCPCPGRGPHSACCCARRKRS